MAVIVKRKYEMSKKAILDKYVGKLVSRKLLAWSTATWLLYSNRVDSEQWVLITAIYLGTQGVIDTVLQWKHGK